MFSAGPDMNLKLCVFKFQGYMVKIPDSDQDSKLIVLDLSLCWAPQFSAS